jgi:hypothetical protein
MNQNTRPESQMAALAVAMALLSTGLPSSASQIASNPSVSAQISTAADSGSASGYWKALVPDATEVGQGQFRRFGFLIYEASLWAPDGSYRADGPFALRLRYARAITRDQIVDASLDQMRAIGVDVDAHPQWKAQLEAALSGVEAGDTLTGIHLPGQGAIIFREGVRLGELDRALANAFFSIWLDRNTTEPALRAALLGLDRGR